MKRPDGLGFGLIAGSFFVALTLVAPLSAQAQHADLAPAQTILVPGIEGGFNHMSVDAEHRRLFAAASTNKTLEVIDLKASKPLNSLAGDKPAAALYAPEFHQLYVTRGQTVVIYDGNSLSAVATIDLHSNLDEMHYDPRAKELYVGCMSDGTTGIAVIRVPEGKLLDVVALPSKPQGFAVELQGNRIFANTPVQQQVAVIDRRERKLLQPFPLRDLQGNTPIALDEARHRLFLGIRHPAKLAVLNTETGRQIAVIDINSDMDDMSYDAEKNRIYISCGEGFVDVVQPLSPNEYKLSERIPTVAGARTSIFSNEMHALFVGVPRRADQPASILAFETTK